MYLNLTYQTTNTTHAEYYRVLVHTPSLCVIDLLGYGKDHTLKTNGGNNMKHTNDSTMNDSNTKAYAQQYSTHKQYPHFEMTTTYKNITPSYRPNKKALSYYEGQQKPIVLFYPCGRGSKLLIDFRYAQPFTKEGLEKFQSILNWNYITLDLRRNTKDLLLLNPNDLLLTSPNVKRTIVSYYQVYIFGDEIFCKEIVRELNQMFEKDKDKYFESDF